MFFILLGVLCVFEIWYDKTRKAKKSSITQKKGLEDMNQLYTNSTAERLPVYADSSMQQVIGALYKGSTCQCIGEQKGMAIILYKINKLGDYKVGFAEAQGIHA